MKSHSGKIIVVLGMASAALCLALVGCATMGSASKPAEQPLVIPDFPTAKEQYGFARIYAEGQVISPDVEKRKGQMSKVSQCYQKVIASFPNDADSVSKSLLELGDCAAQSNEYDAAIGYYQDAKNRFPDEFIQARASYSMGRVLDSQGKYAEAKAVYKQVMDTHGSSQSGQVRDVVRRSSGLYYQVKETKQTKKKNKDD